MGISQLKEEKNNNQNWMVGIVYNTKVCIIPIRIIIMYIDNTAAVKKKKTQT